MKTNANVTVYNRYTSSGAEAWQRTQITDPSGDYAASWESRKGENVLRTGGNKAVDAATVLIPMSPYPEYLAPVAWQALADKSGNWTLQPGDFIVKGLVTDEISGAFTISSLKAKYDDVLEIQTVDTCDTGRSILHHFRIGAK